MTAARREAASVREEAAGRDLGARPARRVGPSAHPAMRTLAIGVAAVTLFVAVLVLIAGFLSDVVYAALDPRVRV